MALRRRGGRHSLEQHQHREQPFRSDQAGPLLLTIRQYLPTRNVPSSKGLAELNQLHHLAQNDPAALKEIQELAREMQRLDPRRFPGNPAMVEQLHTEVLSGVDKLELQLRHDSDDQTPGQVRTTKESAVPPGYEEAVADYYRRLSKGQ